jgi:hypothetical protein
MKHGELFLHDHFVKIIKAISHFDLSSLLLDGVQSRQIAAMWADPLRKSYLVFEQ